MSRIVLFSLTVCLVVAGLASAQSREDQVRGDRKKVEAAGFWIYNDLPKGFAEAKKTGKPLFVILRCVPCVECVKLDDDLVNEDKRVRPLLEKFVCVRVVSTNGLDLSLFQFDTDQSFAAFMLNADGTIYGRFGTRSHRTKWSDDVSIEGLAKALQGALDLHAQYPKNKDALAGKKGPAPEIAAPEKYPLLKDRYKAALVDEQGKLAQSCIHCHMIGDAQRNLYISRKESIPYQVLLPYPHPKSLGLILDPKEKATVLSVDKKSIVGEAGFKEGDVILKMAGQPLLSMADVQWVLHQTPAEGASVKAEVQRGDRTVELTLTLPKGWRQRDDISWRASTRPLRRMAMGGMALEVLPDEDRNKAKLSEKDMALRVKSVGGGNGPYGAALKAGFRQGDVLVSFDGQTDLARETDVLVYVLKHHKASDQVAVTVLRDGKKMELKLPIQD